MRSSFVSLALMLGITFAAPVTYTPPTNNDKAVTKIVDKILQMQSTHKVLFSGNEIKKNKDGSYKVRVYYGVTDCKIQDPRPVAECPIAMENNGWCEGKVRSDFTDVTDFVCVL